jgi:alpha-ribazole phosphatase
MLPEEIMPAKHKNSTGTPPFHSLELSDRPAEISGGVNFFPSGGTDGAGGRQTADPPRTKDPSRNNRLSRIILSLREIKRKRDRMKTKVTLIRHTSVDVPPGICYGQTDVPLKDTFEQEAAAVAGRLAEMRFDKVFTSPLSRCVRLADYCGYPGAARDERLKELDFGRWEMQPFDRIKDPGLKKWFNDYFNVPAPEGESFRMQLERLSAFFDELKPCGFRHVGIFAHGGILTCAQLYSGDISREEAFSVLPPYGGIVTIYL